MTATYEIPLHGIPCGRCGQPALRTLITDRRRVTVHLDSRLSDCPSPPKEVTR